MVAISIQVSHQRLQQMYNTFKITLVFLVAGFLLGGCYPPEKTVTKDYEESFDGITEIEIEGRFLEVSYEGRENDREVYLSGYLEIPESSGLEIRYRKSGSKLKVEVLGETYSGWGNQHKGYISLTGPENIKLNVQNSSGMIDILNVVHEDINLKVNSGSIKAQGLEVERISMRASSGSIKAEDLTGHISCEVNSGQISLKQVEGDVEAKGSSGSLNFEDVQGRVQAKVNSGSMKFINVAELGEITVSSGNVKAENTGLGPNTNLKANSGNIRIQTPSDLEAFNYELTANSGSIKVGDQSGKKKLNISNNSDYTVIGRVSSGSLKIEN